jgi:hypothetical protein
MNPELVADASPKGMSEIERITGVFFEPKKAFTDIAERPAWLIPMLLVVLVSIALTATFSQHIGWEPMIRKQMETSSRSAQLTPEQREQQVAVGAKFAPVIGYVGPIIGYPLVNLISAAVLLGIVAGIMSAPVRFKQIFAILAYAGLVRIPYILLCIVVMFLKNPADFDLQHPLMFNAGAFMDPQAANKFVYTLASAFDLFTIWSLVMIAIGLKAAAGKKLSFGGALFAVVLPWLVVVLAGGALASMFS